MKKYFFSFFAFFFVFCCLGVSFAEENLISQTTAIRAGKLTFQLPSGFQKDNVMYKRQLGEYKFDSVQIKAYPKDPNYSDEQAMDSLKGNCSVVGKLEEINVNGKKVLFVNPSSGAYAYFCENGMLYNIIYVNVFENDYNSAKSFIMNIIRTAR